MKTWKAWRAFKKRYGIPNKPVSLPSSMFSDQGDKYTWENWAQDSREAYPFRYFLFERIPSIISRHAFRAEMRYYDWNSFHIMKEHLLDLRGAPVDSGITPYEKGYLSPHEVIEAAIIAGFFRYVALLDKRYDGIEGCQKNARKWFDSSESKEEKSTAGENVEFYNRIAELIEFFDIKLPEMLRQRNGTRYDPQEPSAMRDLDNLIRVHINEHLIEIVRLRHRMEP